MRFFGFFRRRNRAWRMGTFLAVAAGAVAVAPRSAQAALTSSEKGQIASYVAEGHVATAERVRALVARPDLTSDESADALQGAVVPLTFTDVRAAYLHEMLYGPSSLPSRSVLAVAITRALTARADAVVGRHEADLDQDVASIAEVARIFAFLDANVANAGQPKGTAHDPNAGIGASGYDDAGRALATIITNHARWLKGDAQIPAAAEPVRAQLQLALFDMANDTTTRRFDVANRLGLTGSRRAALTELGFLVLDDGHADVRRIDCIRALFARMPGARDGLEAVALMGPSPLAPLRARGEIVTLAAPGPAASASLFGDDIAPPPSIRSWPRPRERWGESRSNARSTPAPIYAPRPRGTPRQHTPIRPECSACRRMRPRNRLSRRRCSSSRLTRRPPLTWRSSVFSRGVRSGARSSPTPSARWRPSPRGTRRRCSSAEPAIRAARPRWQTSASPRPGS